MKKIREFIRHFFDWNLICVDDALRMKRHALLIFIAVAFITFVMSVLNLVTGTMNLLVITSILCIMFTVLSVITATCSDQAYLKIISFMFLIIIGVSGYFIYNGGTEGFSPIWLCLFPLVGYMVSTPKIGHAFNLTLALMVCIGYLTPVYDHLAYEYTAAFRFRFPVLMVFSSMCAGLNVLVRIHTQRQLTIMTQSLKDCAYVDPVTGIANRNAFVDEIEALRAGTSSLAYAIIDVDHFKRVNDTHGHLAGDMVLKALAELLDKGVREMDHVYRWGGEEFLIVMPAIEQEEFAQMLEQLRELVQKHDFIIHNGKTKVTISVGGVRGCGSWDEREWIRIADECLYTAKRQGRNCVVVQPH